MAAATVRMSYYGGSASKPAGVTAETGLKFTRDDQQNPGSGTPVPIPTTTGTAYSFHKNVGLEVTATGTTSLSNRKIGISSSPSMPTGLTLFYKSAAYSQPTAQPSDQGTNGATPSGYTAALSTTLASYDASSVSAGSTGDNGALCQVVLGVDNTAAALGPGAQTMSNLVISYDEA